MIMCWYDTINNRHVYNIQWTLTSNLSTGLTHKGLDCKDHLKFLRYDDPKVKLRFFVEQSVQLQGTINSRIV